MNRGRLALSSGNKYAVRGCKMTGVEKRTRTQRRRGGEGGRVGRQSAEQALAELEPMISALIKQNRELHRQIDKLSKQTVGGARDLRSGRCGRSSAVSGAAWTATR